MHVCVALKSAKGSVLLKGAVLKADWALMQAAAKTRNLTLNTPLPHSELQNAASAQHSGSAQQKQKWKPSLTFPMGLSSQ